MKDLSGHDPTQDHERKDLRHSEVIAAARPIRDYRLPDQLDKDDCAPFDKLRISWNDELQLAVATPLPTPEELAEFYGTRYRRVMGKAHSFASYLKSPNYRAQVRSQSEWISPKLGDNANLLDVGAGFGLLLWQVKQDRPDCCLTALEPDPDARQHLQNLATVATDFNSFWDGTAFPNGSFDAIILSHVLEHLSDPIAAMRVLRDYVKPGGHILIEVPYDPLEVLEDPRRTTDLPHLWFFSEPGLGRVCEAARLEVLRSATLGIRRRQVKAALPIRLYRRLMRAVRGDWWSERGWYSEGQDRTDLRVLCRVAALTAIDVQG